MRCLAFRAIRRGAVLSMPSDSGHKLLRQYRSHCQMCRSCSLLSLEEYAARMISFKGRRWRSGWREGRVPSRRELVRGGASELESALSARGIPEVNACGAGEGVGKDGMSKTIFKLTSVRCYCILSTFRHGELCLTKSHWTSQLCNTTVLKNTPHPHSPHEYSSPPSPRPQTPASVHSHTAAIAHPPGHSRDSP